MRFRPIPLIDVVPAAATDATAQGKPIGLKYVRQRDENGKNQSVTWLTTAL